MTVERYLEIRSSYGIYSDSIPSKETLESMTEERCHKTMQSLAKMFKEVFGEKETKSEENA